MCCFSQPIISVSGTNIFGRPEANGRQLLVYSMTVNAKKDLAMILPLPVKTPAGEKDVMQGHAVTNSPKLEVVQVGDFEASFVPTQNDFFRLDERFRLPRGAWKQLPAYESYGFAVFKLKPGALKVHP